MLTRQACPSDMLHSFVRYVLYEHILYMVKKIDNVNHRIEESKGLALTPARSERDEETEIRKLRTLLVQDRQIGTVLCNNYPSRPSANLTF